MWLKFLFFITLLFSNWLVAEEVPLRVVTEASYPPFESFNEHKQIVGFDIALTKALCQQIKRRCEFYHQPFDSLLDSVAAGNYDLAISALDITNARLEQVSFSQPYFENTAVYISHAGFELADFSVIAVQSGSSFQHFLRSQRPELLSISYPSYQLALANLSQGKIDAVFLDAAAAQYWLASHTGFVTQVEPKYPVGGLGIAVSKQNPSLLQQINHALTVLKNNGRYQSLYKHYFKQ